MTMDERSKSVSEVESIAAIAKGLTTTEKNILLGRVAGMDRRVQAMVMDRMVSSGFLTKTWGWTELGFSVRCFLRAQKAEASS